jgi:hypothetical protein
VKLDYVSIEKRVGVAIVRFDRKANLNAFNEKLVVELTHAAHSFFDIWKRTWWSSLELRMHSPLASI